MQHKSQKNRGLKERSYPHIISHHLIWFDLKWPHFIWTECTVIGGSHDKLGQRTTQFAMAATKHMAQSIPNSDEIRSAEMKSDEVNDINNTP